MALVTESDIYGPSLSQDGAYIDHIPSFNNFPQGIRCPCTNNCYASRQSFSTHTKTQGHRRWLEALNANRANHFTELEQSRQIVRQQQLIIAKLEREKTELMNMVSFLSRQLAEKTASVVPSQEIDLLDFN